MKQNILVAPIWERETQRRLQQVVEAEDLAPVHRAEFQKGHSPKVSMGVDELVEKYGNSAIRTARRIGEKVGANLAFLYTTRGFGQLGVTAVYYSI